MNASWCSADFYDTSRSLDYLRYPGRLTPDGTNVTKSMFESNSIRFPDDPAAHLGPGSHDYKTPDEVEAEKKAVRRVGTAAKNPPIRFALEPQQGVRRGRELGIRPHADNLRARLAERAVLVLELLPARER